MISAKAGLPLSRRGGKTIIQFPYRAQVAEEVAALQDLIKVTCNI